MLVSLGWFTAHHGRLAIGARQTNIIRQFVMETTLIAIAGDGWASTRHRDVAPHRRLRRLVNHRHRKLIGARVFRLGADWTGLRHLPSEAGRQTRRDQTLHYE